jgi:hypothetical protein
MSYRWQKLKRREKRAWLLIALVDVVILTVATLIDPDYLLVYLVVLLIGHAFDVTFLLAQ